MEIRCRCEQFASYFFLRRKEKKTNRQINQQNGCDCDRCNRSLFVCCWRDRVIFESMPLSIPNTILSIIYIRYAKFTDPSQQLLCI